MTELRHPFSNPHEGAGAPVSRDTRPDARLQSCAAYRRNLQTEEYEYVSPVIASITGYSAQEMSSMSLEEWLARVHPEDQLRMVFEFEAIADGGRAAVTYRFRHKDGAYRWVADHAEVLKESDGTCRHRVRVLREIEDRKRMDDAVAGGESRRRGLLGHTAGVSGGH